MHALLLETIAFVGATVHTFQPAPDGGFEAPRVATVLVEDGVVRAVGPDLPVPEGAREVDLSGLHLVPGLVDALVTFDPEHDPLYLDAGVTLVRDGGSPTGAMMLEKTRARREAGPGPTLHATSAVFASQLTSRPDAFVLGAPATAEEQINEFMGLVLNSNSRIESVTFDGSLTREQHALVCAAASTYGVEAWGPLPVVLSVEQARAQGQRVLVGLDSLLPQGQRFETLPADHDFGPTVEALRAGGWRVVPLLMGTARILRGAARRTEPEVARAFGPDLRTAWRADLETFRILSASPGIDLARRSLERQRRLLRALHDAGVQLVPGSGAPSGFIAPGAGLVDELEEWGRAGIAPGDLLALATARAADALGHPEESGRIAPGRSADMLALGADPRLSIDALRAPELVVVRGRVRERFELEDAVAALVERQEAAAAARSAPLDLAAPPAPEGRVLVDGQVDLVAYGHRTAVERYRAVELGEGAVAYAARVRILPTGAAPARELTLLQVLQGGLVQRFLMTLDVLGPDGEPEREEPGSPAFSARGSMAAATGKLAIEWRRGAVVVGSQRAEEAISLVEGSLALTGLVAARQLREGISYSLEFDRLLMQPVVDRVQLAVTEEEGRLDLADTRGVRVYGFAQGGALLFGARSEDGGRLDVVPSVPADAAAAARARTELELDPARVFRGDLEVWLPPAAPAEASSSSKGTDR